MRAVYKICYRNFCIGRHTCHRCKYFMWLTLIFTVFQCFTYVNGSVHIRFRILCVPANFLIRSFRFWKIWNQVILWSASEAHIWFTTVMFIALIIRVAWIEGWFLIDLLLSLLLKLFLSWVWTSTATEPWSRKKYL